MTRKRSDGIVPLLEAQDRELRWAAAKVLGALGGDEGTVKALCRCLHTDDSRLRLAALRSIAAIGEGDSFTEVAPLLEEPGDVGHAAMEVLAGMGTPVLAKLKGLFDRAGETGRRRILTLAARLRGAQGINLIVRALETGHADEVAALSDRLGQELEGATTRERGTVVRKLDAFLGKKGQATGSVTAVLDLLSRLAGPKAQGRLLEYSKAGHPPRVRRRALEAIARMAPHTKLRPEAVQDLLGLVRDPDFTHVVAPAMSALEHAKIDAAHMPKLLQYVADPDPALRRFAVAGLGQVDSPAAVEALIGILLGDNPDLQRRAADALARQAGAVAPVVDALVDAPEPRVAWVLARVLSPRLHKVTQAQATRIAGATVDWLAPGDPRAEPALTVLRDRFGAALESAALKKVASIRKKRMPGETINLLTPVVRDLGSTHIRARYELALADVMRGSKEVTREVRLNHRGLPELEKLHADPSFDLEKEIKKEKSILEPEELYLIGFHFAESSYREKEFGGALLRWIVQTFAGEPAARAAEHKLLMEGFPPPPKPRPRKKRAAPKKVATGKAPTKKVAVKKAAPKKAPAKKKVAAKKASPKKKVAAKKKASAKKPAKKATKNTPAKKKVAKKPARNPATKTAKKASRSKTTSRKKTVAKKARR